MKAGVWSKAAKCAVVGLAGFAAVVVAAETLSDGVNRGSVPVLSATDAPRSSEKKSTDAEPPEDILSEPGTVTEPSGSSVESVGRSEPAILSEPILSGSGEQSTSFPAAPSEPSPSAEPSLPSEAPETSEPQSGSRSMHIWSWDDETLEKYIGMMPRHSSVPLEPQPESPVSDVISSSDLPSSSSKFSSSSTVSSPPDISETPPESSSVTLPPSVEPPEESSEPTESEVVVPVPDIVNINTAGADELKTLNGISDEKAEAIIAFRNKHGAFSNIYDIRQVDGIGPVVFEMIKDFITV